MFDYFDSVRSRLPEICLEPSDCLGDDPYNHRWRAFWNDPIGEGYPCGIALRAHPVLRLTPCGAWIDEHNFGHPTENGWEWERDVTSPCRRWVSNDGRRAWAKKTQAEALFSLAIRLERHSTRLRREVEDARLRAAALRYLLPNYEAYAARVMADFPELPEPKYAREDGQGHCEQCGGEGWLGGNVPCPRCRDDAGGDFL